MRQSICQNRQVCAATSQRGSCANMVHPFYIPPQNKVGSNSQAETAHSQFSPSGCEGTFQASTSTNELLCILSPGRFCEDHQRMPHCFKKSKNLNVTKVCALRETVILVTALSRGRTPLLWKASLRKAGFDEGRKANFCQSLVG